MKMNAFIKLIFAIVICLFVHVRSETVQMEKSLKSFLKKTRTKNENARTVKFYNGEVAEVDENGQYEMPDFIEDNKAEDTPATKK